MKDAKQILNAQFDELVTSLQKVVSFNTEKGSPENGAPFGKDVKSCLDYTLGLASAFGLETYNCDGYAGHADFNGSTDEVLGILGHLDVVPSKAEEWLYPPYAGEIHDGKLYGRGTMDDKGPMIACLYAVKALKEAGFAPKKTIRLIFGCDEESGMQCVEHYFSKMPFPTVSFSPDGDFPVINREKGIYQFNVVCGKLPKGVTITAGERANVVPSLCTVTATSQALKVTVGELHGEITIEQTSDGYVFTSLGKSAHGSTPDEGVNATHVMLKILSSNFPDNATLRFLAEKVIDTTGKAWGIDLCDKESGKLTCNLGVLRTAADGTLTATVDIRFPVTYNCKQMYELLRANTPSEFAIVENHISEPLHVPSDSKLVTTLMNVYNKEMNVNLEPLAIGGGTYSRCLPNCVAFGPLFPKEEQTIHMPNECVDLVNLRKMAELYLEAIYQLAK
ncbi:MAG: Sapep family Mn(2+)-dependent dipeptidase [Clostridiales bacterium]|nr:Sapep family Mn(2+)-dependent dipeptidase [Clostridiales bacterium]